MSDSMAGDASGLRRAPGTLPSTPCGPTEAGMAHKWVAQLGALHRLISQVACPSAPVCRGWVKRKDKKNMSDKSPTAEITCACGRLAPESGGKGKVRGGWDALAVPGSSRKAPHVMPINRRGELRFRGHKRPA